MMRMKKRKTAVFACVIVLFFCAILLGLCWGSYEISVHEVIAEFDRGYDTLVGEKGVTLSGGQKQRIAIARTVLSPQPILIFDDSLSAVDTQTDAKIRAALKEVQSQTTTLIITQRVASAMDADLILVLEQGRITQAGTHAQLLEQDGLYRRIVEIQTARMNEGGEEA